jgi:hypothetical protein
MVKTGQGKTALGEGVIICDIFSFHGHKDSMVRFQSLDLAIVIGYNEKSLLRLMKQKLHFTYVVLCYVTQPRCGTLNHRLCLEVIFYFGNCSVHCNRTVFNEPHSTTNNRILLFSVVAQKHKTCD